MAKKTNIKNHQPVIDPNGAGLPSTEVGNPSGKGRANVEPAKAPPAPAKRK